MIRISNGISPLLEVKLTLICIFVRTGSFVTLFLGRKLSRYRVAFFLYIHTMEQETVQLLLTMR